MSRRVNRVEEACKEELSEILQREVKDPRIGFVTITRVRITPDLKHAVVYVSVLGSEDEVRDTLKGLNSARGYLRSHLGKHLRLKFLPEIEFVHDRVTESALRLDKIMKDASKERVSGIDRAVLKRVASLIEQNDSAVLLGHQHPDGDSVGSLLGLGIMLSDSGYEVEVSWPDPFDLPSKYEFLPGRSLLVPPARITGGKLVITIDCANLDRLEDFKAMLNDTRELINIDHHPDNSRFGVINIIDDNSSASAEIIYLAADDLGLEVSPDAALCLYTGIVTDTGRFQFKNTTAATLRVAAELVQIGVEPCTVYQNIYQGDSLAYIHLSGQILSEAVYEEDIGLIRASLTQAHLARWGVKMEETEDLIDSLRTLRGHRIAVLFKELEDGSVRVSLRSRADMDIGSVARSLGGGGHNVAAGYTSGADSIEGAIEELRGKIIERGWGAGG